MYVNKDIIFIYIKFSCSLQLKFCSNKQIYIYLFVTIFYKVVFFIYKFHIFIHYK